MREVGVKVVMTGATGLIGKALRGEIASTVVLSRSPNGVENALSWDPTREVAPLGSVSGVDAVIHLAGEPVAQGRWNQAKRKRIRDSRVMGTRNLVEGLKQMSAPPPVLVSASAVGIYGDRGDEVLDESSAPGTTFLAEVCERWEEEARAAEAFGVRVVCVRIGIVLAPNGGALSSMLLPFKMGIGGKLGSGQQWMPWIHIDDVVGLILRACVDESVGPTLNLVSPEPVTNQKFTQVLAKAISRPAFMPVPKFGLHLAIGGVADVVLASQRVLPRAAEQCGYQFRHPDFDAALVNALAQDK